LVPVSTRQTLLSSPASLWVAQNPQDPRAGVIDHSIASQPSALWVVGPTGLPNLREAVVRAQRTDTVLPVVLYHQPDLNDGVSSLQGASTLDGYKSWIDSVSATLGSAKAVVIVEPDALWFVDRETTDGDAYRTRMESLRYAVTTLASENPGVRTYLDAGTSSGSVTPQRMADLLLLAGVANATGFAVNTSSFAPMSTILPYAAAIRHRLESRGESGTRFVVDTARNGRGDWDYEWCNPAGRRIGPLPRTVSDATGLDMYLWVKQPGTSDGSCGTGAGSYGGQFLPDVAVSML
jgi:endoglucanase